MYVRIIVRFIHEQLLFLLMTRAQQVESEDKACDLVLQWVRAADRSKADIRCAVECLRLPHITPMAERKLKEMLSSYEVEVVCNCPIKPWAFLFLTIAFQMTLEYMSSNPR